MARDEQAVTGSEESDRTMRNIGVGCFTFFVGGASGAMTGVLVGTFVSYLMRAPVCSEMPICNWYVFAFYGGLLGAVSLPVLVILRLRRTDAQSDRAARDTSNQG